MNTPIVQPAGGIATNWHKLSPWLAKIESLLQGWLVQFAQEAEHIHPLSIQHQKFKALAA